MLDYNCAIIARKIACEFRANIARNTAPRGGSMAPLILHVFGAFQVTLADGSTARFESDKTCALLVYLAVEADRPHRRDALVGLLWPDEPEQTARHNLRQALFSLRQTIWRRRRAAALPSHHPGRNPVQSRRATLRLTWRVFESLTRGVREPHPCAPGRVRGLCAPSAASRRPVSPRISPGVFPAGQRRI